MTDGVVRDPSEFSITLGVLPSITETQEFVVPKSIPITSFPAGFELNGLVKLAHLFPKCEDDHDDLAFPVKDL
jgi:hypothetical protein